ncbi:MULTISPECIES: hypothetical protein [Bradyrhizobium]|uniref:Uncharacterized protein n=1 Tax=Bradyrhizobium barranii subsp. barranii TaxID=2823807 RepID=A0A9X9Y036_9BRAD|nr:MULTISPECIES: hypothetical protein [Bradyrhizobium]MBR0947654.1 hypothetical protein [Bradyrhizobium liaoningense]MCP1747113.1 hypothetical protein [Bradyrhizobium japonicum]MCP1865629.1 hypothetical protein [Bradyrhizobium japonicum]MCP1895600.1 hypothetical protein [Bradyrhizobium japonicum]MCW2328983.1 hypothetical protein [Bradyrhizobium japonicum]
MAELALPETQYAQSGDFSIAYQVMGSGPVDIILVPGIISHIDYQHAARLHANPPPDG